MKKAAHPRQRTKGLLVQDHGDEIAIYDTTKKRAFTLSEVSATVWRSCDGTRDVDALVKEASKHHGAKNAESHVGAALDQFASAGLVTGVARNMSRRSLFKRVAIVTIGFAMFCYRPSVAFASSGP